MPGNSFCSYGEVCDARCLQAFQRVLLNRCIIALLVVLLCPSPFPKWSVSYEGHTWKILRTITSSSLLLLTGC
jgi:hypothetical protein